METALVQASIYADNAETTRAIGARLGALLQGGEVIALLGDLGAGKTTLVQGILLGMGSRDRVTSPTFTLVNLYRAGALEVQHVDAYRLGNLAPTSRSDSDRDLDAMSLGLDDLLGDPGVVILMEWADIVPHLLHAADLTMRLAPEGEGRAIHLTSHSARGETLLQALAA